MLSDDGKEATADSQEVKDVLKFMADGIKDGAAPKAVTTYKEEESRRAFESGNATFMRNWPYAYALGKDSKIADKFDIATFPGFEGNEGAGVLGGYNLGISAYSKNPEGALAFIEFATEPEQQKLMATEASLPPTLTETYDDPAGQEGDAVRAGAADRHRAGAAAAGVAGLSADQRGDLQQRLRRAAGRHVARRGG